MTLTSRTEKYACPDCGHELSPSMGNGSDGQPNKWWCTSGTHDKKGFNPREVELSLLSAATSAPSATTSTSTSSKPTSKAKTTTKSTAAPTTTKTASVPSPPGVTVSVPDYHKLPDKKKQPVQHQFAKVGAALKRSRAVLLYGPPGTGKSSIAAALSLDGRDVTGLTLTPETPMAELRGFYGIKDGEMTWNDGPGTRAWRHGSRLILDEVNHAGPDVISFLHALLDDQYAAEVKGYVLPTGEKIVPDPNFQVVCTMNGTPDRLPEALADRLSVRVFVKYPMPDIIDSLSEDLRQPALNSILDAKTGARPWLNLDKLRMQFHTIDGMDWDAANILAGELVFGDNWPDMAADIKIGTAPAAK